MMFLGWPSKGIQVKIDEDIVLETSDSVKLLGIILDNKLSFNVHIANRAKQIEILSGAFAESEISLVSINLSYYTIHIFCQYFLTLPIAWMLCSKSSMPAFNSVHKRSLRVVFNVGKGTLEDLHRIKGLPSIHELHLRPLHLRNI